MGVETPHNENTAYGMAIPAFEAYGCSCFSAADDQKDISSMVSDRSHFIVKATHH